MNYVDRYRAQTADMAEILKLDDPKALPAFFERRAQNLADYLQACPQVQDW